MMDYFGALHEKEVFVYFNYKTYAMNVACLKNNYIRHVKRKEVSVFAESMILSCNLMNDSLGCCENMLVACDQCFIRIS